MKLNHRYLSIKSVLIVVFLLTSCTPQTLSTMSANTIISTAQSTLTPIASTTPTTQQTQSEIINIITTNTPRATNPSDESSTSSSPRSYLNEPTPSFNAATWIDLPVIPKMSHNLKDIYRHGLELGNNPNVFSKIGDCGSTPSWFLGDFDNGARFYNLGEYQYLEEVIAYFSGSFGRISLAAQSGFNASSVLTPLWANREYCSPNEAPLECEYRIHKPTIAFITLGANDVFHLESFEGQMRKIIELSLEMGIIPILSTKPDNVEKNHTINTTLARLAYEYQVPLWNYWLAVQPLPNHGLQEDGVHITWSSNNFNNPDALNWGWPVRNLTALQVLDTIWKYAKD